MARIIVEPHANSNVKNLIQLAIENELKVIGFGIAKTKRKVEELEKKFGMNSKDFYKNFNEGKMGDDREYIHWAGEYETLQQLKVDQKDLLEAELCS